MLLEKEKVEQNKGTGTPRRDSWEGCSIKSSGQGESIDLGHLNILGRGIVCAKDLRQKHAFLTYLGNSIKSGSRVKREEVRARR